MLTDAEAVDEVVFGAKGNSKGLANNLESSSLLIGHGNNISSENSRLCC